MMVKIMVNSGNPRLKVIFGYLYCHRPHLERVRLKQDLSRSTDLFIDLYRKLHTCQVSNSVLLAQVVALTKGNTSCFLGGQLERN
jgi:hypothetical protein